MKAFEFTVENGKLAGSQWFAEYTSNTDYGRLSGSQVKEIGRKAVYEIIDKRLDSVRYQNTQAEYSIRLERVYPAGIFWFGVYRKQLYPLTARDRGFVYRGQLRLEYAIPPCSTADGVELLRTLRKVGTV